MKEESIVSMIEKEANDYSKKEWVDSGVTETSELTFSGKALIQMSAEDFKAGRSKGIESEKAKDERIKEFEDKIETILMLCEENGKPVDGFRFRELILELKQLLNNK